MVKKVTWSQRLEPKDRDFVDQVLSTYQTEKGLENKGEALVHLIKNRVEVSDQDNGVLIPEIHYPDDLHFENTCPFGYLKKITTGPHEFELWSCLKQQGPSKKGKPIVLADGRNKDSIRAICEVCQINWQIDPSKIDQVKLIFKELGDKTLSSILYFCTRDAIGEGIKLSPSDNGRFYCIERNRKVTIKKTCIESACPFLISREINLSVSETTPYVEAQRQLEVIQ